MLGACDGELSLGQIVATVAGLLGRTPTSARQRMLVSGATSWSSRAI